jgi:hypothetical protein
MSQPWQAELDTFMNTLEKSLTEINTHGPYATALAVQEAQLAVKKSRAVQLPEEKDNGKMASTSSSLPLHRPSN